MTRGTGATGRLEPGDVNFVIRVMKARCVAPAANANFVRWHYTPGIQIYLDWLAKRFATIGAGYEPAKRAAETLRQIADGDPKVFEPIERLERALLERFIGEAGEILAASEPVTVQ